VQKFTAHFRMKNKIIKSDSFEDILANFIKDGPKKLHVLADFDKTLTTALVGGQKVGSAIAQFRNGNYLTSDYSQKAFNLFDKYIFCGF